MLFRDAVCLVALGIVGTAACRADDGPIVGYLDDLRTHLDDLERVVAAHPDDACAARNGDALHRIESEHRAIVQQRVDALVGDVTNIERCAQEGWPRQGAWLSDLLGRAQAEADRHRAAQSASPGSDAIVDEEARHERVMRQLVTDLDDRQDRARREAFRGISRPVHRCRARPSPGP